MTTTTFWRARCEHGEMRVARAERPYWWPAMACSCPTTWEQWEQWQREERVVYRVGETTYATEGSAVEAGEVWDLPVRRVRVVRLRRVR